MTKQTLCSITVGASALPADVSVIVEGGTLPTGVSIALVVKPHMNEHVPAADGQTSTYPSPASSPSAVLSRLAAALSKSHDSPDPIPHKYPEEGASE